MNQTVTQTEMSQEHGAVNKGWTTLYAPAAWGRRTWSPLEHRVLQETLYTLPL